MIEPITGPGPSGIADKSDKAGKSATNGLFAKLINMLDKTGNAVEDADGSTAQAVALHVLATVAETRATRHGVNVIIDTKLAGRQDQAILLQPADKSDIVTSGKMTGNRSETASEVGMQNTQKIAAAMQQAMSTGQTKEGAVVANTAEIEHIEQQARAATKVHVAAVQQSDTKVKVDTERLTPLATSIHAAQQHATSTPNQNNGVSTVIPSVTREAAQEESGAQSGDKGNQDTRGSQMLAADSRASSSSSVSGSNFQQYLNHKPAPTMTMFDSIQHIAQAARNGHTKLEIQLDPAHLGKIHITLQIDASKQLQVHMIVDQSATRTVIDQQLPALRHALAQQGLDLSGFSMGSRGEQASSGFDGKHSSGGFRQTGNNTESESLSTASNHQSAMHGGNGLSIHI